MAAQSFHADDETDASKAFVQQYRDKYGKLPTNLAALAYDALSIWVESARRANSTQADKIREQLTKKDAVFDSLTGSVSFGPDQTARRPIFVVRCEPEGTKLLRRYDP
jgi:branched-chain amino acid transport system substrate-binding protein